jgi:glycosyltransferase involved in cell wall biosynthesis
VPSDVSVVVPVRNAARYLERSLPAILDQDFAGEYEVIVVDNGSTDGSGEVVVRYPRVVRLTEPERGVYVARHRGVEAARAPLLVFTDPDCVPSRDWLSRLTAPLADPAVSVVIGRVEQAGRSRVGRLLTEYADVKNAYVFGGEDAALYYGYTNNMATRREALAAQGGFLERFRGADTIFVRRVVHERSPSAVRYEPTARVVHLEVDGFADQLRKSFVYARHRRFYERLERVRPLTNRERLDVFRRTLARDARSLGDAALLFVGLAAVTASWHAGAASARLLRRERAAA